MKKYTKPKKIIKHSSAWALWRRSPRHNWTSSEESF